MSDVILYITHIICDAGAFTLRGGEPLRDIGLWVSWFVLALLTILYADAFVTKNRLKSHGLCILGLDRKHSNYWVSLGFFYSQWSAWGVKLCLESCSIASRLHRFIKSHFSRSASSIQCNSGAWFLFDFDGVLQEIDFFLNATKMYMSRPLNGFWKEKSREKGRYHMSTHWCRSFSRGAYMSQTVAFSYLTHIFLLRSGSISCFSNVYFIWRRFYCASNSFAEEQTSLLSITESYFDFNLKFA